MPYAVVALSTHKAANLAAMSPPVPAPTSGSALRATPSPRSPFLRYLYLALCLPGAFWPGYHIAAGTDAAEMLRGMFANHSVSVISSDLLLVALIAVLWTVIEAHRLGMRWPIYLLFAIIAPFALVFPFFLYRRELILDRPLLAHPSPSISEPS